MAEQPNVVVFTTPGHIDIRSFTTFGMSSKPGTNTPIGYFGTGLKCAIAILCRERIQVDLYIGLTRYEFFTQQVDFRGESFDQVWMRKTSRNLFEKTFHTSEEELPFTTEQAKNWELWQAFRELESNTRDEHGTTYATHWDADTQAGDAASTTIVVHGARFVDEFRNQGRTFLTGDLPTAEAGVEIQVIDRPSEHIYYRGIRVCDIDPPSAQTYNILTDVVLTEDRTAKEPETLKHRIKRFIAVDSQDAGVVSKALTAPDTTMEGRLDYQYIYSAPSAIFVEEARRLPKACRSVAQYVRSYNPKPPKVYPNLFEGATRPWAISTKENGNTSIYSAEGEFIFYVASEALAIGIIAAVNSFDQSAYQRRHDSTQPPEEDTPF